MKDRPLKYVDCRVYIHQRMDDLMDVFTDEPSSENSPALKNGDPAKEGGIPSQPGHTTSG
jgi:hypothetical protein